MWNLKHDTNEPLRETNRIMDLREQTCGCQGEGEVGEGRIGSLGLADATPYKMDKQQGPTVERRNYIQYPVINHSGKEHEKNAFICITESLCCPAERSTPL